MNTSSLDIIAPALGLPGHSEAEMFGALAWLCMHSKNHRYLWLASLNQSLLNPVKRQQFMLASTLVDGVQQPVAYIAWANFDADAESRYLADGNHSLMRPEDWNSGDRMWIMDWVAPFGHTASFVREVSTRLPESCFRFLYHKGDETGMQVKTSRGCAVSKAQAASWWSARPMMAYSAMATAI
ncbi:toxin-activating lysine-acyltransferase [Janthinobacterium sp. NFX145]|uniref:toxin-activating lysine-acyltransferase n=1 Tax=Janthinobacterium sp. NFX145 TaxID=3415602 RepID=UPI003CC68E07